MAEFPFAVHQHRYPLAKTLLQRGLAVDIHNRELKRLAGA